MGMHKRNVLLTEFTVQVYTNGKVDWGGADEFLLWLIRHRPKDGFLPYVRRFQKFGLRPKRSRKG